VGTSDRILTSYQKLWEEPESPDFRIKCQLEITIPYAGSARGYGADAGGSTGPHAITLVADTLGIGLCHGLLSHRERRREGCNDRVARSNDSG
jgi:hypothetical protein